MATKKELELELEEANGVLDAIGDVAGDDELSASRKLVAIQEELDQLDPEEDSESSEDEDDETE